MLNMNLLLLFFFFFYFISVDLSVACSSFRSVCVVCTLHRHILSIQLVEYWTKDGQQKKIK